MWVKAYWVNTQSQIPMGPTRWTGHGDLWANRHWAGKEEPGDTVEREVRVMSVRTLGCDISLWLLVTSLGQQCEGYPHGPGHVVSLCMCGSECGHVSWEGEKGGQRMELPSQQSLPRSPHFLVVLLFLRPLLPGKNESHSPPHGTS